MRCKWSAAGRRVAVGRLSGRGLLAASALPMARGFLVASALPLGCAFLVASSAGPADAEWHISPITATLQESRGPVVMHDGNDAVHVIWQDGTLVRHWSPAHGAWGEIIGQTTPPTGSWRLPADLGACVARTTNEIHAIWPAPRSGLVVRSWHGGIWVDAGVLPAGSMGVPVSPRVAVTDDLHVVWAEIDGAMQLHVFYSRRQGGIWSSPVEIGGGSDMWMRPCLTLTPFGPAGDILATWFEFTDMSHLMGRVRTAGGWLPEDTLFEAWDVQCDTARDGATGRIHVASNGMQPACPCNQVLYSSGVPGAWTPAQLIGEVSGAPYEWPQAIAIAVAPGSIPHVVWRHESYDDMLQLFDERLVLAVGEGTWSHDGTIAAGRNAHRPSISIDSEGEIAIAWVDDSEGTVEVYVATEDVLIGIPAGDGVSAGDGASPEDGTPAGAAGGALTALRIAPNPTRGSVVIEVVESVNGAVPGGNAISAISSVRIFDVAGKLVASLAGATSGDDPGRLVWDGRGRGSRSLPQGVYVIEARVDGRAVTRKLVVSE